MMMQLEVDSNQRNLGMEQIGACELGRRLCLRG